VQQNNLVAQSNWRNKININLNDEAIITKMAKKQSKGTHYNALNMATYTVDYNSFSLKDTCQLIFYYKLYI
jgi:hypothetical protein